MTGVSAINEAINAGNITKIGIGIIVVLVVVGFLIGLLITAIIARLVIAIVVIALAVFVWQQRGHIEDQFSRRACNFNATFFGIHLDPPDDVRQACGQRS